MGFLCGEEISFIAGDFFGQRQLKDYPGKKTTEGGKSGLKHVQQGQGVKEGQHPVDKKDKGRRSVAEQRQDVNQNIKRTGVKVGNLEQKN